LLCAWLGRHAARALAMVLRSAYTATAEPVAIAAIAVARAAARSILPGSGDVHRPGSIVTAAWAVA
jgi:hypothetical protein